MEKKINNDSSTIFNDIFDNPEFNAATNYLKTAERLKEILALMSRERHAEMFPTVLWTYPRNALDPKHETEGNFCDIPFGYFAGSHGADEHFYASWREQSRRDLPIDFSQLFLTINDQMRSFLLELDRVSNENKQLLGKLEEISVDLDRIKKERIRLKDCLFSDAFSFGSESKQQNVPIYIYLSEDEPIINFTVYEAVINFINEMDFEKLVEFDAQKGSWIKRILARTKEIMTSEELMDRLREAEYGVELQFILGKQSEADKNLSEALLNVMKSLEKVANAVVCLGSLLLVKSTSNNGEVSVMQRCLTIKELHFLNKNPHLLNSPQTILIELSNELNRNQQNDINGNNVELNPN